MYKTNPKPVSFAFGVKMSFTLSLKSVHLSFPININLLFTLFSRLTPKLEVSSGILKGWELFLVNFHLKLSFCARASSYLNSLSPCLQPVLTTPPAFYSENRKINSACQIMYLNWSIMVSRAHNMCKPRLDPIDCKSSFIIFQASSGRETKGFCCSCNPYFLAQPRHLKAMIIRSMID